MFSSILIAATKDSGFSPVNIIVYVVALGLFYTFFMRPKSKRLKEQRLSVQTAQVDDEVMMTSGIYGVVSEIDGDIAYVEIAPDIEIKVNRAAISKVVPQQKAVSTDKSAAAEIATAKPSAFKAALQSGRPATPAAKPGSAAAKAAPAAAAAEQPPKKFGWAKK